MGLINQFKLRAINAPVWTLLIFIALSLLVGSVAAIVGFRAFGLLSLMLLFVIISIRWPTLALFLTTAFILCVNVVYAHYVPVELGTLSKEFLLGSCLLAYCAHFVAHRQRLIRYPVELVIAGFVLYMLFNAIAFNGFLQGILAVRTVALYAFMYFITRDLLNSSKSKQRYLMLLMEISIVNVCSQIPQFLFPSEIMPIMGHEPGDFAWRSNSLHLKAPGLLATATDVGALLTTTFVIHLGNLLQEGCLAKKRTSSWLVGLFILFVGIVLSGSRASFVGLSCGLLFLWARTTGKRRIMLLFLIVVGAMLVQALFGEYVIELTGSIFGITSDQALQRSNLGRLEIYRTSLRDFTQTPIFGSGLAAAAEHRLSLFGEIALVQPHSYFLKLLVQTGSIGFILWLTLVGGILIAAQKVSESEIDPSLKAYTISVSSGIVCLLGAAVFNELLESPPMNVLFWSLLGLLVGTIKRNQLVGHLS